MAPAIPPSDQCDCDDQSTCSCSEPEPVQVQTPAKEKPNTNNTPSPGKRKVSNTPNGPRTPATARKVPSAAKHTTPIRKPSAPNAKTPNSAPAGAKAGGKRPEPTLLGDFFLGRPSPARQRAARRKSLDVVKAEMRESNVRGVQAPGKVQERVRQWQKNGAAIAIDDPNIEDIVVLVKSDSDDGPDEADRLRVKNRGKRKSKSPIPDEQPGRRKLQGGKDSHANGHKDEDERQRSKTVAPKKRVISDSHWMKNKKSPPRKASGIPKNFLQATAANPPVERKIEDWVKRTTETLAVPKNLETPKRKPRNVNPDHSEEPSSRKGSRQKSPHDDDDGIRVRASRPTSIRKKPSRERPEDDSSWVTSSRGGSNDDGIRIKPSKPVNDGGKVKSWKVDSQDDGIRTKPSNQESQGDGIRIRPSRETSVHEEVQIKQVRKDGSKRRPKEEKDTPTHTPRRRSEKHLKPPKEPDSKCRATSYATTQEEEDDRFSWTTPSPQDKSNRKNRKSDTMTATESLDEIPFGNSAFSVLDLPLGAEAGILNRPTPKRNQSFGVPKVLKRVYNEGMKIVHDNHEPERGGPNQPPSIDSWLNGTSDPFLDGAPETTASLPHPVATSHPSRMPSYKEDSKKEDDKMERDRSGEHGGKRSGSQRKPQKPKSLERDDILEDLYPARNREALHSIEKPSPMSPNSLKRTPATHKTASPKSGRKLFSKEAIFDAFKGESTMARQKDSEPSPFDFIGLRERDLNHAPLEVQTTPMKDYESIPEEPQRKASSSSTRKSTFIEPSLKELPPFPRRVPPTTGGGNRLSTIASVETASASSSITTTESELSQTTISDLSQTTISDLSQTTITQDTVLTDPTSSSLSRTSLSRSSVKPRRKGSKAKKLERSDTGSTRGLTKHSDLLSVLSLPDTSQPGRADSIRPARSIRTMRTHLETATVEDLMREIAEDEAKYMRELNTLVDGVIPVLLTCVLSKNDAAIAAGLFNPIASATDEISFTKPIIDMGIALEGLKSLHKRIPLADIDAFLFWAQSAQKTYQDYLVAWRTGFQNVVVNLEPASPSSTPQKVDAEMKRDKNGDVIRDNGERADVAYLLKRPLVRVKYLARATKGFDKLKQTSLSKKIMVVWEQLETFGRRRVREEAARREDLDAAMVDPTRARDPKTMAPIEGVKIDPSLQVSGKDTFSLDLQHSSGQRMVCQVELILRDLPSEPNYGDILICGFDNTHRYLLFPPINKSLASARYGVNDTELVIMIRSDDDQDPWQELLVLGAEDLEASKYWIDELGTLPLVSALPTVQITDLVPRSLTMSTILEESASLVSLPTVNDIPVQDDVPIGQRRGLEEDVARTPSPPIPKRLPSYRRRGPVASAYERLKEEKLGEITEMNVIDFKELNDAMAKAGLPPVKKLKPRGVSPTKRLTPSRYHKRKDESANGEPSVIDITGDATFIVEMSGALDPYPGEIIEPESQEIIETENQDVQVTELVDYRAGSPDYSQFPMDLPYIPKKRASSSSSIPEQPKTPLKESMQPDFQRPSKRQPNTSTYEEGPPPVPAHRTPSTPETLKKIPILDTPTPRNKNRLVSSPLKHEYQPSESDASGTSSCDDSDYSTSSSSSYSDSSDDELEAIEEEDEARPPLPLITSSAKRISPNGSIYSLANDSLAPSNSASQGPYTARVPSNGTIIDPLTADVRKFVATVSLWNGAKGRWEDIFSRPDQTCSIVVSAGLIEAFEIDSDHASPSRNLNKNDKKEAPLIALGLTPHVPLRQSTVIDIEVTSPPLISSRVKKSPTIRFRALTSPECKAMYEAIHRARMNNPAWKKLEQDRMLAAYGNGNCAYEAAVAPSRRTWFGRKRSYRASARAPSEIASEKSSQSSPSAFSALKRMGGGGLFNIAKSSVHNARGGGSNPSSGRTSMYTTGSSEYSGVTTPKSLSIAASGSMYSNGLAVRNIGSDNLKIRLYRGATSSKWQDMGEARLTVSDPPLGMRHASSLDHGVLKRITVIKAQSEDDEPIEQNEHGRSSKRDNEVVVWLDIVLGSRNFLKYGRNGIAFEIWEDIRGDDGVVGMVPKQGGVSGTSRKWMFQTRRAGDCVWILGLVGGYEV